MDPFATDVLVEILRRLPANSRRLSRLVCRRWRHLVDRRTTTGLRSRAKTLLVASDGSAVVLGDNVVGRIAKPTKKVLAASPKGTAWSVIGSCNGLICLCNDSKAPGAIALANPVTRERLLLPPLPPGAAADIIARSTNSNPAAWQWHRAYGFAHDQMTGRYKVVHLPCRFNRPVVYTLQVFTLGEAAWRDVPVPKLLGVGGARCRFDAGVVGVDGAVYWVAEGTDNTIVSFDLGDERVTTVAPLPVEARQVQAGASKIHLVDVRGRLGMAIFSNVRRGAAAMVSRTDVWVLESARGREQAWALRYTMEISKTKVWGWLATKELMLPHFAHGHSLVLCADDRDLAAYAPKTSSPGVLRVGEQDVGNVIARECHVRRAFAHLETKEPLSIYRVW